MSEKAFSLGILVGRFQTIHSGHEYMINKAVSVCDEVGIFIGSAQESGTCKNPFSFEKRKELIEAIYGNSVKVFPLPDIGVGNNSKWGDYVLENVLERFGRYPDLLVSGSEERRQSWFDNFDISELCIAKTIDISASKMRKFIIDNDFEAWKKYSNPLIWDKYNEMREIIINSKDNLNSDSI